MRIDKERFRKNYRIAKNIYNTCVVVFSFCKKFRDIEEIENIFPIMEYLEKESDKLYYDLFNISKNLDEHGNKIKKQ